MTEAFRFRQFSKFRVTLDKLNLKDFDKFSSAAGWAAANYNLYPSQTRELSTTGAVAFGSVTLKITGRK